MLLLFIGLYIQLFDNEIRLNKDGSLNITEKILVNFEGGYHHGIYRIIPIELRGMTNNYSLGFDVNQILMDGEEVSVKQTKNRYRGGTDLSLRIGDPNKLITGIHLYTIKYSVALGVRYFKDWDELYWNVTGNRWEFRIDSSICTVIFPSPIKLSEKDIRIFVGSYGSKETIKSYILTFDSLSFVTGSLYPGYGTTLAIRFPKGYLTSPPFLTNFFLNLKNYLGLTFAILLPLTSFIFLFKKWLKEGKDLPTGTISVKYKPPENLTAAEAGTILDQKVDMADITSILFDLARMGYLSIEEIQTEKFLFLKNKDYKIKILKDIDLNEKKHLRTFLKGLKEKGGEEFLLSKLKGEFYIYVDSIREELYKLAKEENYFYGNPIEVRMRYLGIGSSSVIIGFMGMIFSSILSIPVIPGIMGGIVISGLITICFAPIMPKRTSKGRELLIDILGFREFLIRVEKERLKKMLDQNPTIFFDFLSYAIALGVVDEWAEKFREFELMPPTWYKTYGVYGPIKITHISHSIGDSISAFSAASSSPRGSSSGFGGGGFSGGGSGGGGGGGW
ncbi:MAG: DUF2207 domain-containing protein [candidate division WOR-3 bacterium]